jgi:hypothetical protein
MRSLVIDHIAKPGGKLACAAIEPTVSEGQEQGWKTPISLTRNNSDRRLNGNEEEVTK